jgi:hypothetical protein
MRASKRGSAIASTRTSRTSKRGSMRASKRRSVRTSKSPLQKNEPPYKGKKWIILKTDENILKNINKINWDTKYQYNIIDEGFHLKKTNPLFKQKFMRIKNIKNFEGNIDEFIRINNKNISKIQLNYLNNFRKDIKDLIKDDLLYIYVVYNIDIADFIATNKDGSICYIRSTDLGGYNKIIINGIKLNLLSWFSMTKEDKNRFFIPIYKAHFL